MTDDRSKRLTGGVPEPEAPITGVVSEAGDLRFQLVRDAPFEIHFKPHVDILTLSLCHTEVECAFNSDRIVPEANRPGMINFHPAGTEIFVRTHHRSGDMIVCELPKELRAQVTEQFGSTGLEASQVSVPAPGTVFLARTARRYLLDGMPGGRMVAESLSVLALGELLNVGASPEARTPVGLSKQQLSRALDYIEIHLSENIGLSDIARVCDLTVFQFGRAFKASVGMTPHQYVLERRIVHACEKLEQTNLPIVEIANISGFSSQSHMTDTFRRMLGTTPARYRRQIRS